MKRIASILGFFLLASCAAEERGDDVAPSPVDAGRDETVDSFTDLQNEAAPDASVGVDANADASEIDTSIEPPPSSQPPDWSDVRWWDYNGEPFVINIYDAHGPDGSCFIPPGGPWIETDPDSGLASCLYPPNAWQHIVCDCIFSRYYPDGGYVGRDP